jgi:hypothetical protein
MSSSTNFADLEASIISTCTKHERDNERKPDYSRAFPFQGCLIKFGAHSTFDPEIMTLKDHATKDSSAPRVPQVLHYFYQQGRMAYIVMELIQLDQVSPEILAEKAAQAVRWMRDVSAPGDLVLGPKGSRSPCGLQEFRGASELSQCQGSGALLQQGTSATRPLCSC